MDTTTTGAPDEFRSKPTWAKVWIMSAGVIMNFLLAIALNTGLILTNGIGDVEEGPIIGTVVSEYPAEKAGLIANDIIISINDEPVNFWSDMTKYIHQHPNTTIKVTWEREGIILIPLLLLWVNKL